MFVKFLHEIFRRSDYGVKKLRDKDQACQDMCMKNDFEGSLATSSGFVSRTMNDLASGAFQTSIFPGYR